MTAQSDGRTRRASRIVAQIPFLIVAALVLVAVILVLADRWRRGAFVFGGAAVVAAVLRAVLPTTRVGLLQVRGRVFDVVAMGTAGAAILWLATSIDALGTGIDQ
ncbi:DUF3017 domain-containing protein [Williamsia sp. CHRR-6]|uniref:DUF3017 domain-containing protein n=1 Tax=Williamsia sp. CHRR-6 TaxID=2835871 RepID=UPI001BDB45CA|nr:DUF3017 domain-containing protein [Williamsia sp. CHRR-6]MBT0566790.1 DUF3017 domain-containing protein [Williamsia sp. CHRR-6]